jgi:hypothetical protein
MQAQQLPESHSQSQPQPHPEASWVGVGLMPTTSMSKVSDLPARGWFRSMEIFVKPVVRRTLAPRALKHAAFYFAGVRPKQSLKRSAGNSRPLQIPTGPVDLTAPHRQGSFQDSIISDISLSFSRSVM